MRQIYELNTGFLGVFFKKICHLEDKNISQKFLKEKSENIVFILKDNTS